MSVKDTLTLVSPTEGQAPPTFSAGWVNPPAGSGSQFEARAAHAFSPDAFGIFLPVMSTSFRRGEYTFIDGAQTSGQVVVGIPWEPDAYSASATAILSLVDGTTGKADVRVNTSGTSRTLNLRNIANSNASTNGTATYTAGTQYRLELSCTFSGNLELRTFLWGSDTQIESITLAATSITQLTKNYFGITAAAAGYSASYGRAKYADGWIGAAAWNTSLFTFTPVYPVIAAHRGGFPNGEETWEAYDYSLARVPVAALEYDLQDLSDGKFACLHDSTVDRTADVTSPITTGSASALTSTQFRTVIMTPQGAGGVVGNGRILDDMASRYTTQLHLPEIKTGSNAASAITQLISLGLASHSLVQAFSFTNASSVASAGLEAIFEMASGATQTWAQIKAAGINHVMRNSTLWTTTDITAAKAAGLKTWVFTLDTTVDVATWLGNGIDGGIISGQPRITTLHGAVDGVADTAPATDALTRSSSRPRGLSDTAAGTDAVTRSSARTRAISDTAAGTDALASQLVRNRGISDTAAATDTVTARVTVARAIGDTAAATDALSSSGGGGSSRSISDSAGGTDTLSKTQAMNRPATDTAAGTDAVGRSTTKSRAIADTAAGTDAVVRSPLALVRPVSDSAPAVATAARAVWTARPVSDTAAATALATAAIDHVRSVLVTLTTTDSVTRSITQGIRDVNVTSMHDRSRTVVMLNDWSRTIRIIDRSS